VRARDELLDDEVGHLLGSLGGGRARPRENVGGLGLGRHHRRGRRVEATPLGLFERAPQVGVVAALGGDDRAQPRGERERDAAPLERLDDPGARAGVFGNLPDELQELLVRQRRLLRLRRDAQGRRRPEQHNAQEGKLLMFRHAKTFDHARED
jgi:hypothetical protein